MTFAEIERRLLSVPEADRPTLADLLVQGAGPTPVQQSDGSRTFLWRSEADEVWVRPDWTRVPVVMRRVPGTDLWGCDEDTPIPSAARCDYWLFRNRKQPMPDPLNPLPRADEGWLGNPYRGPAAPPTPGTLPPPPAELSSVCILDQALPSKALGEARRVRVFQPFGREDPTWAMPTLMSLDAQVFVDRMLCLPGAADRNRAEGRLGDLRIVAVDAGEGDRRWAEYMAKGARAEAAARYFRQELLPWVEDHFAMGRRVLLGCSNSASFGLRLFLGGGFDGAILLSLWDSDGWEVLHQAAEATGARPARQGQGTAWFTCGEYGMEAVARTHVEGLIQQLGPVAHLRTTPGVSHGQGWYEEIADLLPEALA